MKNFLLCVAVGLFTPLARPTSESPLYTMPANSMDVETYPISIVVLDPFDGTLTKVKTTVQDAGDLQRKVDELTNFGFIVLWVE